MEKEHEFRGWRSIFWPVHRFELRKLVPMLAIFFLISFDYNLLRTLKETLVVTAKSSGAEVIPFIKVWILLPGAVFMTWIFSILSRRFSEEKVVFGMMGLFLGYFAFFALVLYPCRSFLHPEQLADQLALTLPKGWLGFVAMLRNWTFTSFYVMSELWSNIILSLLFWGFANQVTRLGEAKRFYALFGIGANLSGIAAGQIAVSLASFGYNDWLPFGNDAWEQNLYLQIAIVIVTGIAALFLYRWMQVKVLSDPIYMDPPSQDKALKKKASFKESFQALFQSRYLLSVATIVVAYNLVLNLVEVIWKHQVKELYPLPQDYNVYMSQVMTITGVFATLSALVISGNSIRRLGWTFTALLTPLVLFITSLGFFSFFFLKEKMPGLELVSGITPLAVVVFFGACQNIFTRAAKYSVFDATKEMAFLPLPEDHRWRGKAAIDGVCSRLGKSGGSLVHQMLLLTFASLTASAPFVACFLLVAIAVWIFAVKNVGRGFTKQQPVPPREPVENPAPPHYIMQGQQAV